MEWTDALSQNLFGFISGLLGAVVGGLFTLYATKVEIRSNAAKEARHEQKEMQSLLDSIALELRTLWSMHERRIGPMLQSLKPGEPFLYYYPLSQNYFVIYDANATRIGAIADASLRTAIVVTFNKCKKVIDGLTYNNTLFLDWRALIQRSDESAHDKAEIAAKYKELCDYAASLKADHEELKTYVDTLLARIGDGQNPAT